MRRADGAGLAALLILGLGSRDGRAEDTTDLATLLEEPVVRTASKTLETASSSPATSTILSADDMRRLGIRTLDEAINFLSLGMTVEGSVQSMEIGARGVLFNRDFGNHVLLLLGYQEGDPGKVFVYDTAIEDGGIKTPGIQTFVDAANQMFLMDLYTSRSQSS